MTALCDGQYRRLEFMPLPMYAAIHARDLAVARSALGEENFQRHRDTGAAMTPEVFDQMILNEIEGLLA